MSQSKPLFGTPLNRAHPLAQGLVGCWLLNEGSGLTAYDSSGKGNHGVLSGAPNWSSCVDGVGLTFLHATPGLITTPLTSIATPNTIFIRALFNSWAGGDSCVCGGYGVGYYSSAVYLSGGTPTISLYSSTTGGWNNVLVPTLNTVWHGLAILSQASTTNIIFDAVQYGPNAAQGLHGRVLNFFGSGNPSFAAPFAGTLSEVLYWNRVLSASEVAYLNALPFCMFDTDDKPFDPSSANTILPYGLF